MSDADKTNISSVKNQKLQKDNKPIIKASLDNFIEKQFKEEVQDNPNRIPNANDNQFHGEVDLTKKTNE